MRFRLWAIVGVCVFGVAAAVIGYFGLLEMGAVGLAGEHDPPLNRNVIVALIFLGAAIGCGFAMRRRRPAPRR